jgi:gliding motility-associated protein GldM
MAGYKETPRQKMIGMMYLVLTALLALNVSKDILNAFLVVNESMEVTNEKFSGKIEDTYIDFNNQYQLNKAKVGPFWEDAQKVRDYTREMIEYVDSIKYVVIAKTEGITVEEAKVTPLEQINAKDNYDKPTNFFIGGDINRGEAFTLNKRIVDYKDKMLRIIDEDDRANFNLGLETDGDYRNAEGAPEKWENHYFYHTILAADVTILNKIKAELYNAEIDVVNYLYSSISAEDFKFDQIDAKVIPKSSYVFQGDEYEAEILVAAYDSKTNPEVYILEGADSLPSNRIEQARLIEGEEGVVRLKLPANSLGTKKYAGIVRMVNPGGVTEDYYFSHDYIVAKASATISATKMNVFYRGVDNPVSISASGKADAQIHPEMAGGNISRSDEGWIVNNLSNNIIETTVKVYADDNGGRKFMGEGFFRVKRLPDPIGRIPGATSGKITKNKLLANPFLICQMPDYVDFKYDFKVISFTMIVPQGGGYMVQEKSESQMFTDKMKNVIQTVRSNDIIVFQDIKVRGPEGSRKIEDINITIQ